MNASMPLSHIPLGWDGSFHGSVHTATIAVCIVLVIFVVILGTFGNGLVLLSALHCQRRRSNFDILIFNLAGADFIMCACLSPTFLYLLFSDPPSPRVFCGGFLFSCSACGLLSCLTLLAIAVHRYSRVRKMRGSLTTTRTTLILLAIYVVSLTSSIGGTLHVIFAWKESTTNCQSALNSQDIYSNNVVLFFISPVVLLSFIAITASYMCIAQAVRLQTQLRLQSLQPILKSSVCKPLHPNTDPTNAQSDMQIIPTHSNTHVSSTTKQNKNSSIKQCSCCSCAAALDRENKAVSMCFVVVIIITLCWMPLVVSHIVELITGESIIIYQVKLCGIALVFLNSALNPYMYAQNNGHMKQRYGRIFWDMLRCECTAPAAKQRLPILSPAFGNQRPTRNTGISPEGATLQFLHPKKMKQTTIYRQCVRLDTHNDKNTMGMYVNNSTITPLMRNYMINKEKMNEEYKPLPQYRLIRTTRPNKKQNSNQTGVKSLVQKTCCHTNAPDDQSLIES